MKMSRDAQLTFLVASMMLASTIIAGLICAGVEAAELRFAAGIAIGVYAAAFFIWLTDGQAA